ncbi:MAG: hypothetical protein AAF975_01050 [Spirochaetota bacterium]
MGTHSSRNHSPVSITLHHYLYYAALSGIRHTPSRRVAIRNIAWRKILAPYLPKSAVLYKMASMNAQYRSGLL